MATIEQVTALLGVIAAAHPDRFEIEFGRFPRAGEPPLPAPTPPRAQARRVYSPRR